MLKVTLLLVKNVCFGLKKDISKFLHQVAAKHTANMEAKHIVENIKLDDRIKSLAQTLYIIIFIIFM